MSGHCTGTAQRSAGSHCDTLESGQGIRGPSSRVPAAVRTRAVLCLRGSRRQTYEGLCARRSVATIRSGDVSGRGPLGECAAWDRVCSMVGGVAAVGGAYREGGGGRMGARASVCSHCVEFGVKLERKVQRYCWELGSVTNAAPHFRMLSWSQ